MIFLAASAATSSPIVNSLATINKFIGTTASFAVVGSLLAMGFLFLDNQGKLSTSTEKIRNFVGASALVWLLASIFSVVITISGILGEPLSAALDLTTLRSFLTQITLGQYMFFQICAAIIVLVWAVRVKTVIHSLVLLLLTLAGILAPIIQSHSVESGSHALAVGSIAIHVMALSFWVGGAITLTLLDENDRVIAMPRFSHLALWSAIGVVVSGTANAWVRLDFPAAWHSMYAIVVAVKIALTLALLGIGYVIRARLARKPTINWKSLGSLLAIESAIMLCALALGAWLSTNESPIRAGNAPFNAALTVVGIRNPDAPTVWRLISLYDPDALFIGFIILAIALYLKGVLILKRRGDSWPVGRTIAFVLALAIINFATSGGLGVYSRFSFEYHMIAHMVLGMIAPIGIVLGAPITLALRTLPQSRDGHERGVRGTLIAILQSKPTAVATNPIVALAIFDGSLFGLYFTSLFAGMMQSQVGHFFMSAHFILAGVLFFHIIIGIDPNPRRVPHLVRIVILFAAMSIHAFFSIALMSTSTLIDQGYYASLNTPWLGNLLADQRAGGSIGWAMGEIPILMALIATFIQWVRDDSRETKRIDRNEARMAARGEPDELAHYNAYLAALSERDKNER